MQRVVLIPGAGGRGDFWDPVIIELRRLGAYDCRTIDWPGVGGNPPDPSVESYDDLTAMVRRTIEEGGGPVALVAQSAGGAGAADLALTHPNLVSHLGLVATSVGIDVEALGATDWRPTAAEPLAGRPEWVYERRPDRTEELGGLSQPTLLVWAEHDTISPGAVGRHLHRHIPGSTLVTYDSDDHWIARLEAADVARHLHGLITA